MKRMLTSEVLDWLAQQDAECYVVGGFVRDRLLQCETDDLDIATGADALGLARRLADDLGGDYYALDAERGAGRVILHGVQSSLLIVDLTRFRGPDLMADLATRDFTINALAASIGSLDTVIDAHGGLEDLATGLVRAVSNTSIRDDPVRALRAVRLATQLGFAVEPRTLELVRRDGAELKTQSGERIRDELASLLIQPQSARGLRDLDGINLLSCIFPCLEPLRNLEQPSPHQWTALEHSLRSVEALETVLSSLGPAQPAQTELNLAPAAAWGGQIMDHITAIESDVRPRLVTLKLATLLHDTGKAKMRSVDDSGRMRFLGHHEEGAQLVTENLVGHRFSNREVRLAATIVRNHMRPLALAREEHVTPRAVYRFFRDTGPAGVETLLLGLADRLATGRTSTEDEGWQRLLKLTGRMLGDYWNRRRTRISPPSLVNGDDLLREFELQPGPIIGELLDLVVEAQVSGEVRNADEALSLVRERLRTERAGLGAG